MDNYRVKIEEKIEALSTEQNENYPNRIYHTKDVVNVLREVSKEMNIKIIDIYEYIENYLKEHQVKIDDIISGEGCKNDGVHPSDFVQKLMYEKIIYELNVQKIL